MNKTVFKNRLFLMFAVLILLSAFMAGHAGTDVVQSSDVQIRADSISPFSYFLPAAEAVQIDDFVDLESDIDDSPDLGTHDTFNEMKASANTYDALVESVGGSGEITVTDAVVETFSTPTATSHDIDLSDANVGDLRVIVIAANPDGTGTVPTINLPSGWSWAGTQVPTGAASNGMLGIIYKVDDGDSTPLATTYTQTCMVAAISVTYIGVDTGTPLDQTVPAYATGTGNPVCPTITTQTDNAMVIRVGFLDGGPAGFDDASIPAGTTLRGTMVNDPPSNGQNLGVADEVQESSGSTGTATWSDGASEEYVAATVALKPAAGGTDYQMDLEVQFTDVMDFMAVEKVCIETGTFSGSENINVTYWAGSSWSSVASDLTASDWNNYTVSLTSSTFTIKFGGSTTTSDSVEDTWNIDSVLLQYSSAGSDEDYVDTQSDIDSEPDTGTHSSFINQKASDSAYDLLTETAGGGSSYVKSVETITLDLSGTATSNSASLGESQDIDNCVPFLTTYREDAVSNFQSYQYATCFFSGSSVYVQRTAGVASGGLQNTIYVVEFDDSRVKVQQGSFSITTDADIDISSAVDRSQAFLIFYYNTTQGAVAIGQGMVEGYFIDDDTIHFRRYTETGTIKGNYYIVEALSGSPNEEFTVQEERWSTTGTNTGTSSITAVNLSSSIIVASYQNNQDSELYSDESFVVFDLSTTTAIRWATSYNSDAIDFTAYIIDFDGAGYVQTVRDSAITGETDDNDITAVNTANSMIWGHSPCASSHGSEYTALDGASGSIELTFVDSDTVRAHRNDADAAGQLYSWDVIEFTITVGGSDYTMELEGQFADIPDEADQLPIQELCIQTGTFSDSEDILVQWWDVDHWETLWSDLTASSWNNITIAGNLTESTFTIRFRDGTQTSDTTTQDTWNIDAVLIYLENGGDEPAIEKNMVESVDANDTQTNSVDYDRTYTESVSVVDVITTVADIARNLVETIGVVGILTMVRGREKELAEAITATDVRTFSLDYARNWGEAISVVDVWSKTYGLNRSESISAIDAQSNAGSFVRDLVEAITVAETFEGSKAIQKIMFEAITATDVRTTTADYVRDWVETISAIDAQSNAAAYVRDFVEAITAAETIEISRLALKNMVETIAVSYVIIKAVGKNLTESISAIDVQSYAGSFVRDFVEAITATDVRTFSLDYARNWVESINVVDLIDTVQGTGHQYEGNFTENITVYTWVTWDTHGGTLVGYSLIYQLFFSLEMWGYLGVIAIVIGGYFVSRKDIYLGIIWFIVECLIVAQYLLLVTETPDYWWQIFILLIGGMLTCVYPLWEKR